MKQNIVLLVRKIAKCNQPNINHFLHHINYNFNTFTFFLLLLLLLFNWLYRTLSKAARPYTTRIVLYYYIVFF